MQFVRTGIGQDGHRFLTEGDSLKPCILGGVIFEGMPGLKANSDGDVVFHAICNAISSLTGKIILGIVADKILAEKGITDSAVYLQKAMDSLGNQKINHVAISLECLRPRILPKVDEMRKNIAKVMGLKISQVGITATTSDGLTDSGCGDGVQCICILTSIEEV